MRQLHLKVSASLVKWSKAAWKCLDSVNLWKLQYGNNPHLLSAAISQVHTHWNAQSCREAAITCLSTIFIFPVFRMTHLYVRILVSNTFVLAAIEVQRSQKCDQKPGLISKQQPQRKDTHSVFLNQTLTNGIKHKSGNVAPFHRVIFCSVFFGSCSNKYFYFISTLPPHFHNKLHALVSKLLPLEDQK